MAETALGFYDPLATHYHLIFEDWNQSIERQARILNSLLRSQIPRHPLKLLDCACGIGTQALGFAQAGHRVVASDQSPAAVARAKVEAELRGLDISFLVSDMTSLAEITSDDFDLATALDNALPHLSSIELGEALRALRSKLKPHGLFLASIRDYDQLIIQRPAMQEPAFYGKEGQRRIVHQVWDWIDHERYFVHLYITTQSGGLWSCHHFASAYRCLLLQGTVFCTGICRFRGSAMAHARGVRLLPAPGARKERKIVMRWRIADRFAQPLYCMKRINLVRSAPICVECNARLPAHSLAQ